MWQKISLELEGLTLEMQGEWDLDEGESTYNANDVQISKYRGNLKLTWSRAVKHIRAVKYSPEDKYVKMSEQEVISGNGGVMNITAALRVRFDCVASPAIEVTGGGLISNPVYGIDPVVEFEFASNNPIHQGADEVIYEVSSTAMQGEWVPANY